MATTHTALHIYEIVELIVSNLDRASIHRCERVSNIFRTVALGSPTVAQTLSAITPVRASDIKRLTHDETVALGNWNLHVFFAGINISHRHNFRHQLVIADNFDELPHYARPTKFDFNPHLDPKCFRSELGVCDVRGTTVELHLPETAKDLAALTLVSPDHYATNPAIAVVKLKLRAHGNDFSECWLRVPSGIRLRDLVRTQRAMLRTVDDYGGACCGGRHPQQCIAVFVHDTLTSRLRELGGLE
ncbi:hypothetical protein LTR36_001358 [Oleoguttula mirabilis]|uniref:F-box domain-containing protein n=1 Tax=Oleoguttula mirabilis TaxID=1507867 RepID=A0AAV9JNZ9_9PEZI|nr:hypothetical protein LTR36_001358 [Oleoguttula mirabilis]